MIVLKIYDVFLEGLPKIDLHGYDREGARVAVNDFIDEAILMNYSKLLIIHGIGEGIVKNAVHEALSKRKEVISYHVVLENIGCTIVEL